MAMKSRFEFLIPESLQQTAMESEYSAQMSRFPAAFRDADFLNDVREDGKMFVPCAKCIHRNSTSNDDLLHRLMNECIILNS